ncbi:hypothetical protein ACFVH9_07180 [Streptomyces hirsutus]|uniref:hypothetical protein n=1 Tax=Streptomyces hirsutus TaxID=35620 RepID=UPI00363166EF
MIASLNLDTCTDCGSELDTLVGNDGKVRAMFCEYCEFAPSSILAPSTPAVTAPPAPAVTAPATTPAPAPAVTVTPAPAVTDLGECEDCGAELDTLVGNDGKVRAAFCEYCEFGS